MQNQEFMYVFQISKLIIFEVEYYTLGDNKTPYFSTSANEFIKNKRDYCRGGQAQEDLLPHTSLAYRFYKKWDPKHLSVLTNKEYKEVVKDIEELKRCYNFIERTKKTFKGDYSSRIPFYEVVAFSKQMPKKHLQA